MAVVIETTLGDITVDLFIEERPRACLNFIKLCKLKYYNFNLFHTIERDFIAQTGDPTGAGDGGESIWGVVEGSHKRFFEAESLPKIKHTVPGLLSLVSVGKFMVGSQFFFTLGSDLTSLDAVHCVIGEVVEGREILRKLNEAIVDEKFRPYQDIRVTHTVILDDPFSDPRGFQVPSRSPSPTAERLQNGRIGADEDIDDTAGKTIEEIQEMLAEREAKARATILEIVGDLPDADIAPPENVLFVCKLNPVTTDDDLEIIFSRFGKVKGCEVIRDKVSGDSLQYAFVEFEEQKACEAAYFKMDNVLIDDRRIHVDFSQSVSKVQWRGKGRGFVNDAKDRNLDFNNLRNNRDSDRRKHRDRSRSPLRKARNNPVGERQNELSESRKRSYTRDSPQYKRKLEERPRQTSRQSSDSRERSTVRKRMSPSRRSKSKDRQIDNQRSTTRQSPTERVKSPHKMKSGHKSRQRSMSGDRNCSRKHSADKRERRSSPGSERKRPSDMSSSRNGQEKRANNDDLRSSSRNERGNGSPGSERKRPSGLSCSRNGEEKRANNDDWRSSSRNERDIGSERRRNNDDRRLRDQPRCSQEEYTSRNGKDKHGHAANLRSKEYRRDSLPVRSDKTSRGESSFAINSYKKHSKLNKTHEKSKKKKKAVTSSSSSDTESDSSSTSTSSSSSSSSDEKRKKSKKSKKSSNQKSKKRPKKKSNRNDSSSSSD